MSSRVLQFLERKNILKMVIDFGELCLDCIILPKRRNLTYGRTKESLLFE
jgi:hypothetical protein